MSTDTVAEIKPYSKEYALALLGPEVMADIAAKVAAAPPPSPELLAEVRRLFAAVPLAIRSQ